MRSAMSVDANGETVERGRDPARQLRLEVSVKVVVREMREVRAFRADQRGSADGFGDAQVRGVFRAKQGVDDEDLRASQNVSRLFRKRFRVGDIREWADAVAENVDLSVRDLYRNDVEIRDREVFARLHWTCNCFRLRCSGLRPYGVIKDVAKAARNLLERASGSINRHLGRTANRERPNVVDAVDVIRVVMRVQHRVDAIDARGHQLQS